MNLRKWIVLAVVFGMMVGCNERYSSGDRVLVSKEAYDISDPKRFEVVVFKWPGNEPGKGPMEGNTPKNYIKRLLGLPGELIAIFFGRLYRWTPQPGDAPPFDDKNADPNELFRPRYLHHDEDPARSWFEKGDNHTDGKERGFEIVRKPPRVTLSMRRIVFDNDYQAKDLKGKLDRWNPRKSEWKPDAATGFTHEGKAGDKVDWLRYNHLLRPDEPLVANPHPRRSLITDTLDYNSFQPGRSRDNEYWVGDLMLECNVDVVEPKGEFFFELSRGPFRYQARWDLASGQCTLTREKDGKKEEMAAQATRVKTAGSYMLRLANFDSRLTVWVDGDLPFGEGHAYDSPDIRGPKEKNLSDADLEARRGPTDNDLEPASIGSKGAKIKINHVRLWRDTYYTTSVRSSDYVIDRESLSDPTRWDVIRKARFATMYVQPGHYLCLGDNSQASSDSRDWGLVPHRLMLGRALVVYFPIERMGPIR